MNKDNPYIEKIENHPFINIELEKITKYKGKWGEYFKNSNPLRLEIGTGLGNFFSNEVTSNPQINFLGMEIKFKRCFVTAEKTIKKGGNNFLVIKEFGQKIEDFIGDEELEQTYIYFPDPWAKKDRQKKHRIMQAPFLETLYKKTKVGGIIVFKTDHREYFEDSIGVLEEQGIWKIENKMFDYEKEHDGFDITNITEFEAIYREHKTKICYLECVKK